MKDIFNFFKTPSYKKADIILEKSNKEKKKLNKKMIIIIFIVEFLFTLSILLNPFGLFGIKIIFGIENNYYAFFIFLLLNFISLLLLIFLASITTKFTLNIFKIEKSFTESLFIFLSGSFFIASLLGNFFSIINFLFTYLTLIFLGNILITQIIYILSFILGILGIIGAVWLIVSILVFYGNIFKSMGKGIGFLIVNSLIIYLIYILLGIILGNYAGLIKIF